MAIISLCPSRGVLALLYLLLWRLTCRSVSEPVSVWNKPIVETHARLDGSTWERINACEGDVVSPQPIAICTGPDWMAGAGLDRLLQIGMGLLYLDDSKVVLSLQGLEKPVIIVSTAVTRPGNFVGDAQRLNVALTRAKHHLIMVNSLSQQTSLTS